MSSARKLLATWQLKWVPSIGSVMVLLALASAPLPAAASGICNQPESVGGGTPAPSPSVGAGWDVGNGQCNGDFTVSRDATFPGSPGGSGIELGMRIEQRSAGQLNPPDHVQRDYTVQLGFDPSRPTDRAWWNFQQSIAYDGLINNLDALTFIIRTDAGPSIPSAPSFDMLALRAAKDDRITNGTATYTDLYQTSQNPLFAPWFSSYNPADEGAWTLTLVAMKSGRVLSVSICVHTPAAECDPAPVSFRDVRRPRDIDAGLDLGGTQHLALNFTGAAGAAGDTWITVYDETPDDTAPTNFTGSIALSADVLIHRFNNKKGAGLLALFNEAPPVTDKGLALLILDSGAADTLVLATVNSVTGQLTTLASTSLGAGITINQWYRLNMDVTVTAGSFSVIGRVFRHTTPTDPNSGLGTQVGATLTLPLTNLASKGLTDTGEVGIIASATSTLVDSSVTNFEITVPGGPI